MKLNFFGKILKKKNYKFLRDYHSRFNPECNTERVCIDSLSIALELQLVYKYGTPLRWSTSVQAVGCWIM